MDKFLCAKSSHSSSDSLLDLMKKSRESNSESCQDEGGVVTSKKWESVNMLSVSDVNFQTRYQKMNKTNNTRRGWRVIDGEKVYVTIRGEGVIKATGRDAFLLSKADEKRTKPKKKSERSHADGDTTTKIMLTDKKVKITDHFTADKPPRSASQSRELIVNATISRRCDVKPHEVSMASGNKRKRLSKDHNQTSRTNVLNQLTCNVEFNNKVRKGERSGNGNCSTSCIGDVGKVIASERDTNRSRNENIMNSTGRHSDADGMASLFKF